jgi:hypothetical protein
MPESWQCPVSPKAANVRLRLRVILQKSGLPCESLPGDLAKFEATRRACGLAGWEYRLAGALDRSRRRGRGDPIAVLPVLFHLLW